MPEGHTIHRAARLQQRRFGGKRLRVDSPQGRFGAGASVLDGRVLERVDARGKHLFYRWEGDSTLHVHLGLFGRFRVWTKSAPSPTDGTRLRWRAPTGVLHLSGPTACDLIDAEQEAALISRLGPDPLAPGAGDLDRILNTLDRRRIPIAQALLDQRIIAGLGNVYRAELLFLSGIHPMRPANRLTLDEATHVWELAQQQLSLGERTGRIVTVDPDEAGYGRIRDVPRGERFYVYKRAGRPCRRCGTAIERAELAARKVWWCPMCQPT